VPKFCEKNDVPQGLTIDAYADIIEHCSFRAYPEITVAIGFCMFIKREVIAAVGLFDRQTFGRGYGEENDFCFRAAQLGYRHVMCDDTYIYHNETASFQSEEKKRLIREHEKILLTRYPDQMKKNAEYIRSNPHQYIRDNIDLYTRLRNGKKNILYVLHQDFREDASNNVGGTQFHVKDLMMGLRKDYNIYVAARDGGYLRLTAYTETERLSFKYYIGEQPKYFVFYDQRLRSLFDDILDAFAIDVVHVHHAGGLSFDIFYAAAERRIPIVVTLHDFYYDCPNVKLLDHGKKYCAGTCEDCRGCLDDQLGYTEHVDYRSYWQKRCREVLNLSSRLITPSQSAKEIYSVRIPELKDKIQVIPHGMEIFRSETEPDFAEEMTQNLQYAVETLDPKNLRLSGWAYVEDLDNHNSSIDILVKDCAGRTGSYHARKVRREDIAEQKQDRRYAESGFEIFLPSGYYEDGTLEIRIRITLQGKHYCSRTGQVDSYHKIEKKDKRIAFIGWLNEAKGSQLACGILNAAGSRYEWFVIGGIADTDLYALEKNNLIKKDLYTREEVVSILRENQIDLVCILPIWPETFCYTLSEALLAGVPVLTTELGAMGERVAGEKYGWIIPHDAKPEEMLQKIDQIFADPESYDRVKAQVTAYSHKTIAEMDHEYDMIYQELFNSRTDADRIMRFDAAGIYNGYAKCNLQKVQSIGKDGDLEERVDDLERKLRAIQSSVPYKVVLQLTRMNLPMKAQFAGLLRLCYRLYRKMI
jgi:glycosyltransferase involved in cell wall biosynthesis